MMTTRFYSGLRRYCSSVTWLTGDYRTPTARCLEYVDVDILLASGSITSFLFVELRVVTGEKRIGTSQTRLFPISGDTQALDWDHSLASLYKRRTSELLHLRS
ncbi:hypothetical protein L208DRAFT_1384884 [Tricholoma matsutake]|nr:hypothetical protein L208DRAFT_1384884 [Tricholoma matsutake 945]